MSRKLRRKILSTLYDQQATAQAISDFERFLLVGAPQKGSSLEGESKQPSIIRKKPVNRVVKSNLIYSDNEQSLVKIPGQSTMYGTTKDKWVVK